jgi:hypothetical protein
MHESRTDGRLGSYTDGRRGCFFGVLLTRTPLIWTSAPGGALGDPQFVGVQRGRDQSADNLLPQTAAGEAIKASASFIIYHSDI